MSEKNVKFIRKQIKNVVQSLMPTVISQELVSNIKTTLQKETGVIMTRIEEHVKETLTKIDDRNKDMQSYILREVANQMAANVKEEKLKNIDVPVTND